MVLDNLKGVGTEIIKKENNCSTNLLSNLLLCSALYVLYRTNSQILKLSIYPLKVYKFALGPPKHLVSVINAKKETLQKTK